MIVYPPPTDVVAVHGTIEIHCKIDDVFLFVSDMRNDTVWRKEVTSTHCNGPIKKDIVLVQKSRLSKNVDDYASEFICTEFEYNKTVTYETTGNNQAWQKNQRKFTSTEDGNTVVFYDVEFERKMAQIGTGINLPRFIVRKFTKHILRKYLRKLKLTMEN